MNRAAFACRRTLLHILRGRRRSGLVCTPGRRRVFEPRPLEFRCVGLAKAEYVRPTRRTRLGKCFARRRVVMRSNHIYSMFLALAALVSLEACGADSSSSSFEPPSSVETAALSGCRSPDEGDCATCCRTTSDDGCAILSHAQPWTGDDKPWYNITSSNVASCETSCSPCAQCLEQDERELSELESPPACDCSQIEIGSDPCFSPGCECYCHRLQVLTEACPSADA